MFFPLSARMPAGMAQGKSAAVPTLVSFSAPTATMSYVPPAGYSYMPVPPVSMPASCGSQASCSYVPPASYRPMPQPKHQQPLADASAAFAPRTVATNVIMPQATGSVAKSKNSDEIRVVSLGAYCGVRQSLKKFGYDGESMPFDWMRTRVEGILYYVRNDFSGFLDFVSREIVPGSPVGVAPQECFRDYYHSFWHDDPTSAHDQEKYHRRIARFQDLRKREAGKPLLFMRSVSDGDEMLATGELLKELVSRFGADVKLCLMVDFQTGRKGPVLVEDSRNLLVQLVHMDAHREPTGAPYGEQIQIAVDWALGKPIDAIKIPSVQALPQVAENRPAMAMHAGLLTYEEHPPGGPHQPSACAHKALLAQAHAQAPAPLLPQPSAPLPPQSYSYAPPQVFPAQPTQAPSQAVKTQQQALQEGLPTYRASTSRGHLIAPQIMMATSETNTTYRASTSRGLARLHTNSWAPPIATVANKGGWATPATASGGATPSGTSGAGTPARSGGATPAVPLPYMTSVPMWGRGVPMWIARPAA